MLTSGGHRMGRDDRNFRDYNYRLTPDQLRTLESEFSRGRTLHSTDLALLAMEMGADEKDVQVTFLFTLFLIILRYF